MPGNVPLPKEVAGGIAASDAIECDQTSAALHGATGLVESDVARATDAEHLQVDPARLTDLLLVGRAGRGDLVAGEGAVGDVDRIGRDVDVVKEVLPHEAVVALQGVGLNRPVFVEVERHDSLERDTLFAMQADQFVVHADRGAARGEAEHRLLARGGPLANEIGDLPGHRAAGVGRLIVDGDR